MTTTRTRPGAAAAGTRPGAPKGAPKGAAADPSTTDFTALRDQAKRAAEPPPGVTRETALTQPLPALRSITLEIARADDTGVEDEDPEVITIALSSEQPVLRYDWWEDEYYWEVLDHDAASVDLSYARDGMPFLFEHFRDDQRGICENVRVDSDRKLRTDVRFSARRPAQELKRDMLDGIRPKVSVYAILAREFTQTDPGDGGIPTRRYTKWMPVEGSSVSIPADYGVGVGRGAAPTGAERTAGDDVVAKLEEATQAFLTKLASATASAAAPASAPTHEAPRAQEQTVSAPAAAPNGPAPSQPTAPAPAAPAAPSVQVGVDAARAADIAEIASLATQHGMTEKLNGWLTAGRSKAEVMTEIMEAYKAKATPITPLAPGELGLSERDKKEYSLGRAVRALVDRDWSKAGREREISRAIAQRMNRETPGIYVPTSDISFRAVQSTNTATKGQELVYKEYQGLVDVLRNRTLLIQLGARLHAGLQGTYSFVRKTAGSTTQWLGENPGAGVTESDLTFAQVNHNPKTLKATLRYTSQQMAQGAEAIDQMIKDDIVSEHSQAMDRAGISGDGTANDPIGILNATGVNLVALGANGAVPAYKDVVALKTKANKANVQDLGTFAYLTTPELQELFETTAKLANTIAASIWDDNKMAGFRAESSNNVPGTLTKGTAVAICHALIYGAFSEMAFLEWGALELLVNPYSQDTQGIVRITSNQFADVMFRYPQAFSVIKDAKTA